MKRLPWALWLLDRRDRRRATGAALEDGIVELVSYMIFVLVFATVGALIASRRPRNPIGWILLSAGIAYEIGGMTVASADGGGTGSWETLLAGWARGSGWRRSARSARSVCCCSPPGGCRRRAGGRSPGSPAPVSPP